MIFRGYEFGLDKRDGEIWIYLKRDPMLVFINEKFSDKRVSRVFIERYWERLSEEYYLRTNCLGLTKSVFIKKYFLDMQENKQKYINFFLKCALKAML